MKSMLLAACAAFALAACGRSAETPAPAEEAAPAPVDTAIQVAMQRATAEGVGESIGSVTVRESPAGAVFSLSLTGLPAGQHGFHVHEHGSCAPHAGEGGAMEPAGAAGAHWDPQSTGRHLGPEGAGHLGDLPLIEVGADGAASASVTAPRIQSIADLRGRALMIHAGGDNYTDTPANGGGGARLACGVIS